MQAITQESNVVPITLAIDIGGSSIKGRCFRRHDEPVTDRLRILTPRPATQAAVLETIGQLFEMQAPFDRVSIGFPGVVMDGVVKTAPNLDGDWCNLALKATMQQIIEKPVHVVNDADMHGYGAIEGHGVEMVVVLGTGVGASLFTDGHLVPNLELGHHPFEKGMTYEERLGQLALDESGKGTWNRRCQRAFDVLRRVFNFRVLYVGGGNARKLEAKQPEDVVIVPNAIAFAGGVKLWDAVGGAVERTGGTLAQV